MIKSRKTTPLQASFAALGTLFTSAALLAGTPDKTPVSTVMADDTHPMYLGTITSGIKGNDSYQEGNFSIVAPVWSSLGAEGRLDGTAVFLEPYVSYGEGGEIAASLGWGFRHLFGSQPVASLTRHDGHQAGFLEEGVIIGANMFVDMLDTEADNQFWQLGFGLEVKTRYIELSGNYYLPLTDRQLAEERRTRQTTQSSRSRDTNSVSGGDPFATGNLIAQDAVFTTTRTTTTRSTTIENLFRRYEEGMEGWDVELALLVPGLDRYMDVKVIGGYYNFDNQTFGPQEGGTGDVEGLKAGLEVRPVPAVILSGTWYEDSKLVGGDWTAGVQIQIPFEGGDLGDGKNFWSRIGDSFKPRRRHLAERMAEPVRRQNAAIKVGQSEEESQRVVAVKTKRVTRVVSQSTRRIVLKDDVVFVNNGAAVGNGIEAGTAAGSGTAETPVDTVQAAATIAGSNSTSTGRVWNVYTQGGTGMAYSDSVTLSGSTRFISSQQAIGGVGGKSFGGNTTRPVINGGFNADGFSAPEVAVFELNGYEVAGGFQGQTEGVFVLDVPVSIIQNNVVRDINGGDGISVLSVFTPISTVISNNEVTNVSGSGISVLSGGFESVRGIIQSNAVTNASLDGIVVNVFQNQFIGSINANMIDATGGSGINLGVSGGDWEAEVTNNVVIDTDASGIMIDATNAQWTGSVANNTVVSSAATGIAISASSDNGVGTSWNGNISSNTVLNNVDGLVFSNNGPGSGDLFFSGSFTGNVATGNSGVGITTDVVGAGTTIQGGPFDGNISSGNGTNFSNNPLFFGAP